VTGPLNNTFVVTDLWFVDIRVRLSTELLNSLRPGPDEPRPRLVSQKPDNHPTSEELGVHLVSLEMATNYNGQELLHQALRPQQLHFDCHATRDACV